MKFSRIALAALSFVSTLAVAQAPQGPVVSPPAGAASGAIVPGLDVAGFSHSVRPQDDLFQAVNGEWLKNTEIPADKADYGTFIQLRDRSDERVRGLVEALASAKDTSGNEKKIGDYYRSYMDEAAIDKAGLEPVKPWFAQIDAVKDKNELAVLMGRLQGMVSLPLPIAVGPDDKDPTTYRAQTWQGGLGMPDRDYYLKDDPRFQKVREAYQHYIETLLGLAGDAHAKDSAQQVYALEKRLAEVQWSRVENRDPQKTYNPMTVGELVKAAPEFDWPGFFSGASLPPLDHLTVSQPSYVKAATKIIDGTPVATWQAYLRFHLLDAGAYVLPKPFREARFAYRGEAIAGLTHDQPRWQKAVGSLNEALGEAVGQLYVQRYFPPAYKARMQELVNNLLDTYRVSINHLTWMGPQTKKRAEQKLSMYMKKIGYPDKWRDYSKLDIRDGDAFGNELRAGRFEYERNAVRAGQPVDRTEWGMNPQTVNAYYNPSFNEIVFPAAILEPPFFDMNADDAVNYGAIGAIIGHEISHGFDDQGSQYDGTGKLDNWWTAADRKAFTALTSKLVAQYNAYQPIPDHHVNGELTLGENIADLSGLQIAFKAYERTLHGKKAPVIGGLTGEQRFFLSWAQAWREKSRDERALQLLTIDPHSPAQFRADGAAVNNDGFEAAFHVKPGDGMWKPSNQRIRIW
jgi:putative endopeptidase